MTASVAAVLAAIRYQFGAACGPLCHRGLDLLHVALLHCFLLASALPSASAASASSTSYSIVHDGLDAGGKASVSSIYTMDSSLGGFAGISKAAASGATIGVGFGGVIIPIGLINFAPVLSPISSQSIDEGVPLSFVATAIDPDGPRDTVTFSLASGAPSGASIDSASGRFTWTPTEAQGPGIFSMTIVASDSGTSSRSSARTFLVLVREVNTRPIVAPTASQSVVEGHLLTYSVSAQDTDIPANVLTYRLGTDAPSGVTINPSTGVVSWTPTEAQGPSVSTFTILVSDNGEPSLTASQTLTVNVSEENSPPILASFGDQTVLEGQTLTLPVAVVDLDLPPQSFTFRVREGSPPGVSVAQSDATTGLLTWTPTEEQGPGTYTITVEVADNGSPSLTAVQSFKVTVLEVNSPPEVAPIPRQTIPENSAIRFQVSATDRDLPANRLDFSLGPDAPAGANIDRATGNFSWTPNEEQGPGEYSFKILVTDDGSPRASGSQTIVVSVTEVNAAPVLAPIADRTVEEGEVFTLIPTASDEDKPANTLTFSLNAVAPAGATLDRSTGVLTWSPTEAQGPSTNRFTISVTDNGSPNLTASQSFTVIVTEKNAAPVLADIPDQRIVEETDLTLQMTASDSDLPANVLTFSLGPGAPSGAAIDPKTGSLTWTPSEQQGPSVSTITVTVTDNGVPALSASKTFTVSVLETNRAPVLAPIGNQAIDEGTALNLTAAATDADLPANQLVFSLDAGAPFGARIDPATGAFSWTPTEAQGPATNRITIRVTDNASPPASAAQSFTVIVREVNFAPVLAPVADQVIAEGSALRVAFQATDTDFPVNQLTFSLSANAPTGAFINPKTGVLSWTPVESQGPSTNQITVVVTDNGTPSLSASQTLKVIVTEVNGAPVLADIPNRIIAAGKTLSFVAQASDADLPANTLTYILVGNVPAGAAINASTGLFTWTPTAAQGPSTNQFNITVGDSGIPSLSDSRVFTVVVTTGNSAPVLAPIADQVVVEGTTLRLTATAADVDGPADVLTFSLGAGAPANMSIQPNTGALSWTPAADQIPSTNLVVVTVTDSGNPRLADSRLFRVVARPLRTSPTISRINDQTIDENTSTSPIVFQIYDPDTPLEFLRITAASSNPELTPASSIVFDGAGAIRTVVVTPALNRNGASQITLTVEEPSGDKASTEFRLTVNPTPPKIVREPTGLAVTAGVEASFSVLATGSQPLSYQWRLNGAALSSGTNAVLTLTNVGAANAGNYSVEVSNALGKVASREVRLEVSVPLTIVSQSANRTVLAGQDVTLTVAARGLDPITYQWQINGADIGGATDASLVLRSVEAKDAGVYSVVVKSGQETVASAGARLEVGSPVRIVKQPASLSVAAGGRASFAVEAVGTAPLSFQWQLNGSDLPGQNGAKLELANVQSANTGDYAVLVSNGGGTVISDSARLTLIVPPTLLQPVKDASALVGGTARFTALGSGNPPLQFQWSFNGVEIPGATSFDLVLPSVSEANGGRYSVAVSNSAGRIVSEPATLTLIPPPSIDRPPQSQTVLAGATVTFNVGATGTGPLAFQWRRNKANLPGETQTSLVLRNVRPEDAAQYSVVISGPGGLVESKEAALTVAEAVTIVSQPRSQNAAVGGSVRLSVAAKGTPPLAYQWRRGGVNIPGATGEGLSLANLAVADSGLYDVVVSNPVGSVTSQTAALAIIRPPEFITQPSGTNVPPGANVSFTPNVQGTEPLRFQWLLNGVRIPGATNASLSITGVRPQDAGSYSLVVENPGGTATSNPAALILVLPQIASAGSPEQSQVISAADGTFDSGSTRPSESRPLGLLSLPSPTGPRWFAWRAPSTGIATFSTSGSDFDTLLSVFSGAPSNLVEIGNDDDRGGFLTSEVTVNALEGVTYYIRVAGFNGAGGRITVSHRLRVTGLKAPVIVSHPQNRTVAAGAAASFEVNAQGTDLSYEWFVNGAGIPNETRATLAVQNVQDAAVARYTARVYSGSGANRTSADTLPAALQIGSTAQFAQDKLGSLLQTGEGARLAASPPSGTAPAPTLTGTSGSLVFSTFGAAREQNEPNHGGVVGGASMWLSYQATQSGTLRIGTEGSSFDTVLAVYSASGTSYSSLKLLGADDNGGKDGKSSQVVLPVIQGSTYYIAVDGVNGANGVAKLNYALGEPPVIALQPRSFTTSEGANEALFVLVSGGGANSPSPGYQWFKNGLAVPGATEAALFLLSIKETDAGEYGVVASNFAGATTSAVARVTVSVPIRFSVAPKSQSANPGDLVVFTSLASGTGTISYEWTKNGTPLFGQTTPTLVLSSVRQEDVGEYRLVARDGVNSAASDPAMLSLREAPVIAAPVQNQTSPVGASVTFAVQAIGSGPLSYQWRFNGVNISQAVASTLTIGSVQISNQGEYSVVVANSAGAVLSEPALLVVTSPVRFISQPRSLTLSEGSTAAFSAAATGASPITYQWRFNGADVSGAVNSTLIVSDVKASQAGNYTVVARNSTSSVESQPAVLIVGQPPIISRQPSAQTAVVGGTATFTVSAEGTGPIGYKWMFNQQTLPGATNSVLILASVDQQAAGVYSVIVSNPAGSASSVPARLTLKQILSSPAVTPGLFQFQVAVPEGKRARVQVSADLIIWTDFMPEPIPSGTVIVEDRQISSSALKFYRVVLE
jgi:hypothetical protein